MRNLFLLGVALQTLTMHLMAIEGLKLTVQSSNAVVSWPSRDGETYIIQHRSTLHTNTPWVTLTNGLAAALNTNWTSFVHTGAVTSPPPCPGNGGPSGGPPSPGGASGSSASAYDRWMYEG